MDGGIDLALSTICFPNCEKHVMNLIQQNGKEWLYQNKYLPIGSSLLYNHKENFDELKLPKQKNKKHKQINYPHKNDFDKRFLMICPTMLLPQKVSKTDNAYYATMSLLYNILEVQGKNINDVDIILTSFCCGYGKMYDDESFNQIMRGINDYKTYGQYVDLEKSDFKNGLVIAEPNLEQQPKYYCNTEFIKMNISEMEKIDFE